MQYHITNKLTVLSLSFVEMQQECFLTAGNQRGKMQNVLSAGCATVSCVAIIKHHNVGAPIRLLHAKDVTYCNNGNQRKVVEVACGILGPENRQEKDAPTRVSHFKNHCSPPLEETKRKTNPAMVFLCTALS